MQNESLFSIFFKRTLLLIFPIMLLFSFASRLDIFFSSNTLSGTSLMNTYFGFESFFLMIDDINVSAADNVARFIKHFGEFGNFILFNIPDLGTSIKGGNVLEIIANSLLAFVDLTFYPALFLIYLIVCIGDVIAILSNILAVLLSAFYGVYNLPYTEIYDDLPPLVSNVIAPIFL